MLEDVKQMLLDSPEHIVNLLETYKFAKIKATSKEIRCAFDEDSNPTAIVIRLCNNEFLGVMDYERNLKCDLIDYFIKTRGGTFKTVINAIKEELGITEIQNVEKPQGLFGGLFNNFGRGNVESEAKTFPESMLDTYELIPNKRFYRDGISLETQDKFKIGFDVETQRITIPIYNAYGELMGIKGRCNFTPDAYTAKYMYLNPGGCPMSQTLYGFSVNYTDMLNDTVMIFESEKSVMQLDSMGYSKGVALGSNSLSVKQASLINRLSPKKVIFMLDNSLPLENTARNVRLLEENRFMQDYEIYFFDWTECNLLQEKDSPTDRGKAIFEEILEKYVKPASELPKESSVSTYLAKEQPVKQAIKAETNVNHTVETHTSIKEPGHEEIISIEQPVESQEIDPEFAGIFDDDFLAALNAAMDSMVSKTNESNNSKDVKESSPVTQKTTGLEYLFASEDEEEDQEDWIGEE